jgi:hypothetical protein
MTKMGKQLQVSATIDYSNKVVGEAGCTVTEGVEVAAVQGES